MSTYYCHSCAISLGHLRCLGTQNLTGSQYQLDKYIKHTAPTGTYGLNSVFDVGDYPSYRDYVIHTQASGSVEVDGGGRVNVLWCAGKATGLTFTNGVPVSPTDAVKVVLHNGPKVHAFPTGSMVFGSATCSNCGAAIVT